MTAMCEQPDHPGFRASVLRSKPSFSPAGPEGNGGYGAIGFRGGDQQAGLPDEGAWLNLRLSYDTTCDKLTTRLVTAPLVK